MDNKVELIHTLFYFRNKIFFSNSFYIKKKISHRNKSWLPHIMSILHVSTYKYTYRKILTENQKLHYANHACILSFKKNKLKENQNCSHYSRTCSLYVTVFLKYRLSMPNCIVVFYGKEYDRQYTRSIQIDIIL